MKNNKELQSIINNLQNVWDGEPWFGQPVKTLLGEVDEKLVYKKPNESSHSMIELLYHMITWADFTLQRVLQNTQETLTSAEALDWRTIDPAIHQWKKGMEEMELIQKQLIAALNGKEDDFLKEKVDFREYKMRFLLNGFIQHQIYHAGQVAYLNKLLQ